jgi:hypothetical protein
MFDWQTLAVAIIILCALAYTGRRALSRLRSFRTGGRSSAPSCATGCGSCGSETKDTTRPVKVLVQINSAKPSNTRQSANR